jgi:hypothetical protein
MPTAIALHADVGVRAFDIDELRHRISVSRYQHFRR